MGKNTTWGILAHVDAGKTTLSEALLYRGGAITKQGRVDHGDAFLDTDDQEKKRGITIYSKPACFNYKGAALTLLDTPGHVDFATETERALWVLDYCILLVSGVDGVQAHTRTLFKLLGLYQVPTIIFINKCDQPGADEARVFADVRQSLSDKCYFFNDEEDIAMAEEAAMEEYLKAGQLQETTKTRLIRERKCIPVLSGSALKQDGIEELMDLMVLLSLDENRDGATDAFGAKVYKIEALGLNHRLSFAKITSGQISAKDSLNTGEKVDQIRLYSGNKYTQLKRACAGDIVALVGLKDTYPGQGLGVEEDRPSLRITPVLSYAIEFVDETDPRLAYEKIKLLSEEDTSLGVSWDEDRGQICIDLMGQVQTQVLTVRIKEVLGYEVSFVERGIIYKETLAKSVEGVGHFEPLRHYAEAHIYMEPLAAGSGIQVECDCSTDQLALNWQRLITTHILEKDHLGVAIGAPVTDIKYTVIGGKAHIKHTEGGDFREASYRAIRQGFMEAGTIILEPYYNFEISLPTEMLGRAMSDVTAMSGSFMGPEDRSGFSLITGQAPAATILNYQATLTAYTKGLGNVVLDFAGYFPCHNPDEIMTTKGYNPLLDVANPPGSVFCAHGTSDYVAWDQVKSRCHVPCLEDKIPAGDEFSFSTKREARQMDEWIDIEEIDRILFQASHSNGGKNPKKGWHYGDERLRRRDSDYTYVAPKELKKKEKYMLVDGYNLIHAWPELKEVLEDNLDGARGKLLDILSNYKAMTDYNIIAVFDAYRVKGHNEEASDYLNIHQVFTREAQTADSYIQKFTHDYGKSYDITVVTSDGMEQLIIRGAGAHLISSKEFIEEVARRAQALREEYDIK